MILPFDANSSEFLKLELLISFKFRRKGRREEGLGATAQNTEVNKKLLK